MSPDLIASSDAIATIAHSTTPCMSGFCSHLL